jgi:hypothetical protein
VECRARVLGSVRGIEGVWSDTYVGVMSNDSL